MTWAQCKLGIHRWGMSRRYRSGLSRSSFILAICLQCGTFAVQDTGVSHGH